MNLTLFALSTSFLLQSPMISSPSYSMKHTLKFNSLFLNHFHCNFIYDKSHNTDLLLTKSSFVGFFKSPVRIENAEKYYKKEYTEKLKKKNVTDILEVLDCVFVNCSDISSGDPLIDIRRGGAIYYAHENGQVIVYGTLFDNCYVENGDGGAIFVCGVEHHSGYTMNHTLTTQFNSSYCCYSDCNAITKQTHTNEAASSGYGPIMHIFSKETNLFYSSSINSESNDKSIGAQFDLTASNIQSMYINSTKGNSEYCAGIEYRDAQSGFFRFQTLVNQEGRYICSFRDVKFDVDISYCNFINDTISSDNENSKAGIFNINDCEIKISNFCFYNINFGPNSVFVNAYRYKEDTGFHLFNCSIESKYQTKLDASNYQDNIIISTDQITYYNNLEEAITNEIILLNLGSCAGDLTPPPAPTMIFTNSVQFSKSDMFSNSGQFTETGKFSETGKFTETGKFSETGKFTQSGKFTETGKFTQSGKFTETGKFTQSGKFTETGKFSESGKFTETDKFSQSGKFTETGKFSESGKFTKSKNFLETDKFSESGKFTKSKNFLETDKFSESGKFTKSKYFSETDKFSESGKFTKSKDFSESFKFTESGKFTRSNYFGLTNTFKPTSTFSDSDKFTKSKYFSETDKFSESKLFTKSNAFTNSQFFSMSLNFTESLFPTSEVIVNFQRSKGISVPLISGIAAAVVAVLAIILAIIFYIRYKRKNQMDSEGLELNETNDTTISTQNPLYGEAEDDPFKQDFMDIEDPNSLLLN